MLPRRHRWVWVWDQKTMPSATFQLYHPVCLVYYLPTFLCLPPGCEVKEHGFLGQPGSEVPVHTGLLRAILQRQLRTVQTGCQGERGERATAESTGWTGQERARKATVSGKKMEKCVIEKAEVNSTSCYIRGKHRLDEKLLKVKESFQCYYHH